MKGLPCAQNRLYPLAPLPLLYATDSYIPSKAVIYKQIYEIHIHLAVAEAIRPIKRAYTTLVILIATYF